MIITTREFIRGIESLSKMAIGFGNFTCGGAMKLFQWKSTPQSDEEYIAKLRRDIAILDRFRFWLALFQLGLLAAAIAVFSRAVPMLLNLGQNAAVPAFAVIPLLGFIGGTVIGMAFGWTIHEIFHGLINVIGGMRSERLLIKFYDAANQEEVKAHKYEIRESSECESPAAI